MPTIKKPHKHKGVSPKGLDEETSMQKKEGASKWRRRLASDERIVRACNRSHSNAADARTRSEGAGPSAHQFLLIGRSLLLADLGAGAVPLQHDELARQVQHDALCHAGLGAGQHVTDSSLHQPEEHLSHLHSCLLQS